MTDSPEGQEEEEVSFLSCHLLHSTTKLFLLCMGLLYQGEGEQGSRGGLCALLEPSLIDSSLSRGAGPFLGIAERYFADKRDQEAEQDLLGMAS